MLFATVRAALVYYDDLVDFVMSDKSKTSTFSKYAKGLLSRPATSNSHENRPTRTDSAESYSDKTFRRSLCYAADSPISAIAAGPDSQVVIAGREILKVLVVGQTGITKVHNLRGGTRVNLNYSSNDVKWGIGATAGLVATATSNGSIVTWNLEYANSAKVDRAISGHNRAVNRLAFNPGNGSWLLSASQDGSMKLWDLRERDGSARFVLHGKAEAVRDVQFNSTNALELAAVYDNGTLQKWDLRNPKIYERKLNAHHGLALALDWHEDGRHLVTGGRDKIIKVWDMGSEMRKPVSFLHTMAPVARVAWRPATTVSNSEIASCSFSMDNTISIWNLRRPYIASRVFESHSAVATGILWKDHETLWSCSKDQTFRQHLDDEAPSPINCVSHYAFGWNNNGDIALCIGDRQADKDRFRLQESSKSGQSEKEPDMSEGLGRSRERRSSEEPRSSYLDPHMSTFRPIQSFAIVECEDDSARLFRHLARNYIISKTDPIRACAHNALIAYRAQRQKVSKSWKMIKLALEHADRSGQMQTDGGSAFMAPSISTSKLGDSLIHRDLERLRLTPGLTEVGPNALRPSSPAASFIMPRYSDNFVPPMSLQASTTVSRPRTADSLARMSTSTRGSASQRRSSENEDNLDGIILPDPGNFERNRPQVPSRTSTVSEIQTSDQEGSLPDERTASPMSSRQSSPASTSTGTSQKETEQIENSIITLKPNKTLSIESETTRSNDLSRYITTELHNTVKEILDYYQELGDVQTCSTIVLTLADRLEFDTTLVDEWHYWYIDLLRRRRLFAIAADVVKNAESPFINSASETDIVMQTACSRCSKEVPLIREAGLDWMCTRCQNTVLCIVCGVVVKGEASWCLSCAHAAHPLCRAAISTPEFAGACVAPNCLCRCTDQPDD